MSLKTLLICIILWLPFNSSAQKDWHFKSPEKDGVYGIDMSKAAELLKDKTPKPVIVAVIDIGTDVNHKDLKPFIWRNAGEVPGNNTDDDRNGFTDDIHGWNFLGGSSGDIMYEASEKTRVYRQFKKSVAHKNPGEQAEEMQQLKKLEEDFLKEQKKRETDARNALKVYTMNRKLHWKILFWLVLGKEAGRQIKTSAELAANYAYFNSIDVDSLREIVIGDDPQNPHERFYGSNNVTGPEPSHGTHVAGIITGIYSRAQPANSAPANVRIMVLRAVPWGDERDKDVANAIRYAADNGAAVINMSFGKTESPHQAVVDSAILYALQKDVLLVHSAGNEGINTDNLRFHPFKELADGSLAGNWLEVGATGKKGNKKLVAGFSNYGKRTVDLFAPGVKIYSTMPQNRHGYESGTSMAGPVVAGVAAVIRSYFPGMNAAEVKELLMQTVTKFHSPVSIPGKKGLAGFAELSVSGGIVNAGNAVEAAIGRDN